MNDMIVCRERKWVIMSICMKCKLAEEKEEEEEEICPSCGDVWTNATRCDCPEKWAEEGSCKWTDEKTIVYDDRGAKCWLCDDCNGWEDWGVNCSNYGK